MFKGWKKVWHWTYRVKTQEEASARNADPRILVTAKKLFDNDKWVYTFNDKMVGKTVAGTNDIRGAKSGYEAFENCWATRAIKGDARRQGRCLSRTE